MVVDLLDISEGGCKIRGGRGFAEVGDRVAMKVDGMNTPPGTIVWVKGELAGVAFEGSMHPAMLDFLCEGRTIAPSQTTLRRII